MTARNEPANTKFDASKEGADPVEAESDIGFDMYLNIKEDGVETCGSSEMGATSEYQRYYFRVNKFALYYGDSSLGYRGIFGALALRKVRSPSDKIESGSCCVNIEAVGLTKDVLIGTNKLDMYCFTISASPVQWELCHEDKIKAREARGHIMFNVIKNYYYENGLLGNMNVLASASFSNIEWTWSEQDEWTGLCAEGKTQSPININDDQSVMTDRMRLYLNYFSGSIPVAKFNGHEMIVEGDFGQITHQLEIGERKFQANSIKFKFPSEHSIEGHSYDGEMIISHKAKNGQEAFVSIFMKEVTDGDGEHNQFIDGLSTESWEFDTKKSKRLDARPDPSQVVRGGIQYYFQKTFYWYTGSYAEPPCTQPVFRFIMKEAINIPTTQFKSLKEHTFMTSDEPGGNVRRQVPSEGRMIYYHVDKSVNCKLPSQKILDAAEEEVAKVEADKPKEYQGKFIKAVTKLNTFAATYDQSFPSFSVPHLGFEVTGVPQSQLPSDTREYLLAEERKRLSKYSEEALKNVGLDPNKVKRRFYDAPPVMKEADA